MHINFNNLLSIQTFGFQGFETIRKLQTAACASIPNDPGVYLVLRLSNQPPLFLATSTGGHFKKKDPTVPITLLQGAWVAETIVLNIGKAGGSDIQATLRSRLSQYMKYGMGKAIGHQGGRYIWQLADAQDLVICWLVTTISEPRATERELIGLFKEKYGKRPFANLID